MLTSDSEGGLVLSAQVPVKYYSEKKCKEKFLLPSLFTATNYAYIYYCTLKLIQEIIKKLSKNDHTIFRFKISGYQRRI